MLGLATDTLAQSSGPCFGCPLSPKGPFLMVSSWLPSLQDSELPLPGSPLCMLHKPLARSARSLSCPPACWVTGLELSGCPWGALQTAMWAQVTWDPVTGNFDQGGRKTSQKPERPSDANTVGLQACVSRAPEHSFSALGAPGNHPCS